MFCRNNSRRGATQVIATRMVAVLGINIVVALGVILMISAVHAQQLVQTSQAGVSAQGDVFASGPILNTVNSGLNPALDITSDGLALAHVLSPEDAEYTTLWVQELASGKAVQLPGRVSQTAEESMRLRSIRPRWSPQGSLLAYLAEEGDALYLHVWHRDTGRDQTFKARTACSISCVHYDIQWSPDGRSLVYMAINEAVRKLDPDAYAALGGARLAERRRLQFRDPEHGGVTIRESAPNLEGGVDDKEHRVKPLSDVVMADVASETVTTLLTGAEVNQIFLSSDGRQLLVIVPIDGETTVRQGYQDFYILPILGVASTAGTKGAVTSEASRVCDGRGVFVSPVLHKIKQFYSGIASWSPDSSSVAFAEQGALVAGDVWVLNAATKKARNLTATLKLPIQPQDRATSDPSRITGRTYAYAGKFGQVYYPPIWSQDGKKLFVVRSSDHGGELWSLSTGDGEAQNLTARNAFDVLMLANRNGVAMPGRRSGEIIAAVKFSDHQLGFISVDPSAKTVRTVAKFPGSGLDLYGTSYLASATHVPLAIFPNESSDRPQEIFSVDFRDGRVRQLTQLNREFIGSDPGERREISWNRPDGQIRHALLHLPPAASRTHSLELPPVIMDIYPTASVKEIDASTFANRAEIYTKPLYRLLHAGYAILTPSIAVKAGGGACEDVGAEAVRALDAAGATGRVDIERAGIFGHSFGGWTVNCIVTQTDRFKAAVSADGVSDMISNAFTPDQAEWGLGGGQTNIDHSIWEAPQLYMAESPVLNSPKINTPLLIVHGKADTTVAMEQSLEMYVALSRLHKTVTLALYDDRGHSNVLDHPDYNRRVMEWFGRYLLGQ